MPRRENIGLKPLLAHLVGKLAIPLVWLIFSRARRRLFPIWIDASGLNLLTAVEMTACGILELFSAVKFVNFFFLPFLLPFLSGRRVAR
jgi:hypothetical protein